MPKKCVSVRLEPDLIDRLKATLRANETFSSKVETVLKRYVDSLKTRKKKETK